jgi:TRAP-type C4-dicarboxylate transport system substrate-binding protein
MKSAVCGIAFSIGLMTAAHAQTTEWRLAHYLPPAHPLSQAINEWAKAIETSSGGTLKVTVFPSEQLGKAFDGYSMARDGIAEISFMSPGYTPGRFPIGEATALPFLIATGDGGSRAVDEWYRQYAAKEMNDAHYCVGFVHDPGALHLTNKKVMVPDDVKGLKIRPAGGTVGAFMFQLGATNVQASPPEARQILERGLADGITFPWNSVLLFKLEDVVKLHMNVPLYTSHQMFVINNAAYAKLSGAAKKAIDDNCTPDGAVRLAAPWAKWEAEGRIKIKALAGHEVYDLSPDQLAQWQKAAGPIRDKWADSVRKAGYDPTEVMNNLTTALKRSNAAF